MRNYKVRQINQQFLKTFYRWCLHMVKSIDNKLEQIPNESINEIFGDTQTVFSLKQLPNLLRSPSIYRKIPRFCQGLFNCNNKNCKLCAIDVKPYSSFKAWNHVIWYIKSHIICQSKNVFYFLISASCNYSTKYIDKAVYLVIFELVRRSFD